MYRSRRKLAIIDPSYAALYLETHLELDEGEAAEPELLRQALSHVAEALGELKMPSEQAKLHQKKLDKLLSQQGIEAIYGLGVWLKALGLKLTFTVDEEVKDKNINSTSNSELTV